LELEEELELFSPELLSLELLSLEPLEPLPLDFSVEPAEPKN